MRAGVIWAWIHAGQSEPTLTYSNSTNWPVPHLLVQPPRQLSRFTRRHPISCSSTVFEPRNTTEIAFGLIVSCFRLGRKCHLQRTAFPSLGSSNPSTPCVAEEPHRAVLVAVKPRRRSLSSIAFSSLHPRPSLGRHNIAHRYDPSPTGLRSKASSACGYARMSRASFYAWISSPCRVA